EEELNQFQVETVFSIVEELPILGVSGLKTNYLFTSDIDEVQTTGEIRYKPNTEDLTFFFANGNYNMTRDEVVGFQLLSTSGVLRTDVLASCVKTSPVH
ncbi:hypothetical protein, partial [Burkholderia vietnamiensis]|uniref:hypothetical protein n=1 Tax=Burkholderia vietnamiensis TaxID=60552 RepID=UPI00352DB710